MKPERLGNKGPVGKDREGGNSYMPEPQEKYEEEGQRDVVTDIPSLEPFDLRALDSDHTPNFTKGPKPTKTEYGKFTGRGDGGVGL